MEQQLLQELQSTVPDQADCWFLSDPFRMGMVYRQLTSMEYTYVVGLDVGGGESMAYIITKPKEQTKKNPQEQKKDVLKAKALTMDSSGSLKIHSMLCFTDHGVSIGREVAKHPGFIQNFKRSPKEWGNDYNQQYTYRDLMKAFISQLWKQILKYNDEDLQKAFDAKKVLLTVGCPASPEWTSPKAMTEYQKLLQEATGSEHVAVLPESTAAIMSAILKPEKDMEQHVNDPQKESVSMEKINFEEGIAILDAGSISIDFTFVLLGKALITRSCPIGGHKLDEMMLQTALEDSGKTEAEIPEEQKPEILLQLRGYKEDFYPEQISLGRKSIDIWGRNKDGEIDRDAPPSFQLKFAMNRDFMERAMSKVFRPQGVLGPETSWIEICKEFIWQTKEQIGNYPFGKVVITGGTSQVAQWKQAVEDVYRGRVVPSQNPASSVARGLCYAKSLEMNGRDYVDAFQQSIQKKGEQGYKEFAGALASYTAYIVCDEAQKVTTKMAQDKIPTTVSDLANCVKANVENNNALMGDIGKEKTCKLFAEAFQSVQSEIYEKVNETSQKIYEPTIPSTPVTLTVSDRNIIENMDISSLINAAWINKVLPTTLYSSLSTMLVFAIWLICPMNSEKIDKWLQRKLSRERERLSENQLIKIAADLKLNRKSIVSKVSKTICKKIQEDEIGKKEFQAYVQRQAEIALGKVLFLVFDEQPR